MNLITWPFCSRKRIIYWFIHFYIYVLENTIISIPFLSNASFLVWTDCPTSVTSPFLNHVTCSGQFGWNFLVALVALREWLVKKTCNPHFSQISFTVPRNLLIPIGISANQTWPVILSKGLQVQSIAFAIFRQPAMIQSKYSYRASFCVRNRINIHNFGLNLDMLRTTLVGL